MVHQNCPGVLQVEMKYNLDQQTISNVFHVDNSGGGAWGLSDIEAILGAFLDDYWTAAQKALLPTTISLTQIVATDLTSLTGLKLASNISPPIDGTKAANALPNNATMAVKLLVPTRGRGRAGRVFWPCLPDTEVTLSEVGNTYIGQVESALAALIAAIPVAVPGSSLAVLHRRANGVPLPEGEGEVVIGVTVTDSAVDSQKNRLPNHKRHKRPA